MSYLIWQPWPIGLCAGHTYARGFSAWGGSSHADKKAAQCADLGRVRCRGYFGGRRTLERQRSLTFVHFPLPKHYSQQQGSAQLPTASRSFVYIRSCLCIFFNSSVLTAIGGERFTNTALAGCLPCLSRGPCKPLFSKRTSINLPNFVPL